MDVAVYARISDDKTGRQAGVGRQEKDCRKLAKQRGWKIGGVFTDNDVSASTGGKRPAYERMLSELRVGKLQAVIAWHPDRLYRRLQDLEGLIDLTEQHRTKIVTVMAGDVDLSTASGRMNARILASVAKHETERTRERVRRALEEKAANGEWKHGGDRPFGYQWSEEAGTITPYEPEASLVREVCTRILAGESRRAITKDWHSRGLRTTHGTPWSISYLARVLKSPRIVGLRVHRGEIVGRGNWESLIDQPTWERVQRTMRRQGNGHRGRQRRLLTGMVECGNCGQKLSAKTRRRTDGFPTRIYRCLRDTAASCGQLSVLADPVERIVLNTAWTYLADELPPVEARVSSADTSVIDTRLVELAEAEADLAASRRSGDLTSATYFAELRAIADERRDLERERDKRLSENEGLVVTQEQFIRLQGPPQSFEDAADDVIEFWRGVVGAVFEKVVVRGGWKGKRFSSDRLVLVPREGFEGVSILDPDQGYGVMAEGRS